MTMKEKLVALCVENGMWPQDAEKVCSETIGAMEKADGYKFHVAYNEYPPAMLAVMWMSVKTNALKWIDANCPKAWYRPMFAD